ncbi:ADP-ribosylhydrolase ARH1-like [Lethenteron reissneri]|uniref:ADP-ribosylhydrolase ARH1-like n=1 Tax=Lethenteron reissneri TaxID=7753 RepID=UPI002AB5DE37|nr:ADP-ribosylhydrolase ARH1-like [Lethenteron reissneri]
MAAGYVAAMLDMEGRKPGPTSILGTSQLRPGSPGGFRVPFSPNATGCGAAMRAMCIGLRYPREEQLDDLVEVSLVSGKMTHNNPTGYLGAVAAALLVSCAVRRDPVGSWGRTLTRRALPAARRLVLAGPLAPQEMEQWKYFVTMWESYLLERNIAEDTATTATTATATTTAATTTTATTTATTATTASTATFPASLSTPEGRDEAYKAWSLDGWAGRSGHDAPMIAYDAILRAAPSMERRTSAEGAAEGWELLCSYGMFHGGDSDSTGVIAGACWGALWGLQGVPSGNHQHLEYRERLVQSADALHRLAWPDTLAV